ncbi:MAG: hypothetical protein IKZ34_00245 [Alphaproteobacteria bacterium]|nr:hypothetical protein [Alphaproteobacteria bacterium]
MNTLKTLDRNTLVYIVNEITKHQNIKNMPTLKIARLLYLLWLEYASLYPEYKIPAKSPMNNMVFANYERGPSEEVFCCEADKVRSDILSGKIPKFSQTEFHQSEKIRLEHAFEVVRNSYSYFRQEELCGFITVDLVLSRKKPKIKLLEINEKEKFEEVSEYVKNRGYFEKRRYTQMPRGYYKKLCEILQK